MDMECAGAEGFFFLFAQGCLYLCVFLRQQKHRCATCTYMYVHLCVIYGNYFGVALSTPYF